MSDESEVVGLGEDEHEIKRKYSLRNILDVSEVICEDGRVLEVNEESEVQLKKRIKSGTNHPYIIELSPIEKKNRHYR